MRIESKREISAEPEKVWQILGEQFGEISEWSSGVVTSTLDGPLSHGVTRTCELSGSGGGPGGLITEEVTQLDRDRQSLTYHVRSGLPPMFGDVSNAWQIRSIGQGQSTVSSELTVDLKWWAKPMTPMVRKQFGRTVDGLLKELARTVEDR